MLMSFAACDISGLAKKETETTAEPTESSEVVETTTEETTTAEETTTTEETTMEEATTESSEAATTTTAATSETTKAPTKKPTSKPKKSSVPKVPKGYKKLYWGKKYNGHKVYLVVKYGKGYVKYLGYWKGSWIVLDYDQAEPDYEGWSLASGKNKHDLYYEVGN